jgi:WD40 repeat protein
MASPDSKQVAFSSGDDRQLKVINLAKGDEVRGYSVTENEVFWRSVSPDFTFGLSGGIRNGMTVWRLKSGSPFEINNGHHNYCAQFTHDGQHALFGGGATWDLWHIRRRLKLKSGVVTGGHIYATGTSPSTSRFLTGVSDGTVWLWDAKTGVDLLVLRGHSQPCVAAMVSPDEELAVSQDKSGEIILWRLPK